MDPKAAERIERARKYVLESALSEDTKDNLQSLLDTASGATNGHPDKLQAIADTLLALVIHETKQAVRHPRQLSDAVRDEMRSHVGTCPWRNAAATMPRWALQVYAFRWQIAALLMVGVFSPQAPEIVRIVATVCRAH